MKKLIIASVAVLILAGLFFLVSCSQESDNPRAGRTTAAPIPAPASAASPASATAPPNSTSLASSEESPIFKKYNGDIYAALKHVKAGPEADAAFKDFVDKHPHIPGLGYTIDGQGKMTRIIEKPAEKAEEPLDLSHMTMADADMLVKLMHAQAAMMQAQAAKDNGNYSYGKVKYNGSIALYDSNGNYSHGTITNNSIALYDSNGNYSHGKVR